jgi:alpha-amylase
MINFEFKYDAQKTMNLYSQSTLLFWMESWKEIAFLNYLSSHDDGGPFDAKRTKLLKQVQNFYFLRELLRYFMVMKAPVL